MTGSVDLGHLEDVAVRQAWAHEALGFTPWLAANLDRLGEALGLKLEHVDSEVAVTRFAADILAHTVPDGRAVLIENQLEVSDHGHLGQILTYLAGLDARTVVWVAPEFREAHLSAIRWLNQHTAPGFDFFAVRLRVVRIGDSPLAPLFDVLERPNDWEKRLQEAAREGNERGPAGEARHAFWSAYCAEVPAEAARGKPSGVIQRWAPVGSTGLVLSRFVAERYVGICVRGPRGASTAEIAERLEPARDVLAQRLDVPFDPRAAYLLMKTVDGNYAAAGDRARLIAWLAAETDLYATAITDILGDTE